MLITFEGVEGAGKSTVIRALAAEFEARGMGVVSTREPGEGEFGQAIRRLILEGGEMSAIAELFLFLADRAQHVQSVIQPALKCRKIVLCDRFADSTIVYQGYGRGLDLAMLRELNDLATAGIDPDLTLLLDIDPRISLERLTKRDRLDGESISFHETVRRGFLAEAERQPDRWLVVDASLSTEEVTQACSNFVMNKVYGHRRPMR